MPSQGPSSITPQVNKGKQTVADKVVQLLHAALQLILLLVKVNSFRLFVNIIVNISVLVKYYCFRLFVSTVLRSEILINCLTNVFPILVM